MALIKPVLLRNVCFKNASLLFTALRQAHWNKDYKPGPCPKTLKEFEAAAAKYELLPSEYKPYPDDGSGLGDYPDIPIVSGEAKSPYYPYDFPELKRNFKEPLHADANIYGEDRFNANARYRTPIPMQLLQFLAVMGGSFFLYWQCEKIKMFHPLVPKQYANSGEKHYTFELE